MHTLSSDVTAAESQFCLYVYMGITIVLKQPLSWNLVPKIFKFQVSNFNQVC